MEAPVRFFAGVTVGELTEVWHAEVNHVEPLGDPRPEAMSYPAVAGYSPLLRPV